MYIIGLGAIGLLHSFKSLKVINRISKSLLQDDHKLIDCLIVALKGPQTKAVVELSNRIDSNTTIVLLSNGCLKIHDDLSKALKSQNPKFILGTVTHGAYRTPEGKLVHSGMGKTCLGSMGDYNADHVGTLMKEWRHLNVTWVGKDINVMLEEKLAINCAINPLTALLGCKNGGLLGSTLDLECKRLMEKYLDQRKIPEISGFVDGTKTNIASGLMEQIITEFVSVFPNHNVQNLMEKTVDVLTKTKDNHNSMKVDFEKGQETEIDYLNVYLIETANLDLPFNRMLVELIKEASGAQLVTPSF